MENTNKEREEALKSLNELKHSINLVQFACHKFNYVPDWLHPDRKRGDAIKSSVNSIKLINKDNNMDCIIVAKNGGSGDYVYKSLINTNDKGSIVDFVKNRTEDFSIPKLRKICKNYQQGLAKGFYQDLGFDSRKVLTGSGSMEKPNIELFQNYLQPLTNTSYFDKRGINENIRKNSLGVCFNHVSVSDEDTGAISAVLPFYTVSQNPDDNTKKHLSVYTYQKYSDETAIRKKFLFGGRANSVWINAGAFDPNKKITSLVVSENPLDAVSFAALHPESCGENPILTASGGELGYGVTDTYQNILDVSKADKVILANDNDCKGQQNNAKILAGLNVKNLVESDFLDKNKALLDTKIELGVADYKGFVEWRFSHNQQMDDDKVTSIRDVMPLFVEVRDYYLQLNRDLKGVLDEKDVFKIDGNFGTGCLSTIKLEFKNSKENWNEINESLRVLKFGYSDQIEIERSICKDFNDDLKIVSGVDYKPLKEQHDLLSEFVDKKLLTDKQAEKILGSLKEEKIETGLKR